MPPTDPVPRESDAGSPAGFAADLHLVGARVGERELLERALLGSDSTLRIRDHADVAELERRLATSPGAPALIVLEAEGRPDVVLDELRALRESPTTAALPALVVGADPEPDTVVALYRAGASAVVQRSRFLDEWLSTLRDVIRFWAGTAALPNVALATLADARATVASTPVRR